MTRSALRCLLLFLSFHSIVSSFNGQSLKFFEESIWPITSQVSQLKTRLDSAQRLNVSNECLASLQSLLHGIERHKLWAFQSEYN